MRSILIIDDNEALRGMLRDTLELEGYRVEEASDGREGVQAFRHGPTDLILCDIFMGGQDGLATILELRRQAPGVKIIAISGGGSVVGETFLEEAKHFGAAATLTKPFSHAALLDTVRKLLGTPTASGGDG